MCIRDRIAGAWQARGHEQIAEIGAFPGKPRHWVNSIVIEGNGSTASATVYYAAIKAGGELLATGRYDSELTKQLNGAWKLVHHRYTGDETGRPARAPETGADDRQAVIDLVARYNDLIDRREAQAWAETFVEDGELRVNDMPPTKGREALAAFCLAMGAPDAHHWTTNYIIEIEAESASLKC